MMEIPKDVMRAYEERASRPYQDPTKICRWCGAEGDTATASKATHVPSEWGFRMCATCFAETAIN